jgi:hypothetical protein
MGDPFLGALAMSKTATFLVVCLAPVGLGVGGYTFLEDGRMGSEIGKGKDGAAGGVTDEKGAGDSAGDKNADDPTKKKPLPATSGQQGKLVAKAIPYTLKFTPKQYSDMPALPGVQAYVAVESVGKLLVIGGRSQGMHTFYPAPKQNFPASQANKLLLVIDPVTGQQWSFDVTSLPAALADPLQSSSQQSWYDHNADQMYIVGGYGWDSAAKDMVTFKTILRFPVSKLIAAIMSKDPVRLKTAAIQKLIESARDDRFAVTGGGLEKLGNRFYLSLGQKFTGEYRAFSGNAPKDKAAFTQTYTQQIGVFTLKPGTLDILTFGPLTSSDTTKPFNRRDGVIIPDRDPKTAMPRIAAFGGVFKPGSTMGYAQPIYINDNGGQPSYTIDKRLEQKFSQYRCPVITVFDDANQVVYHTFFGGISHYYYSQTPMQKTIYDLANSQTRGDGMPFIGDVSTVSQKGDGSYAQYILPEAIPMVNIPPDVIKQLFGPPPFQKYKVTQTNLIGASGDFLLNSQLIKSNQAYDNEVICLSKFDKDKTVTIGYIYGSITAVFPYALIPNRGTFPGNTVFEVTLTYSPTDAFPGDAGIPANPTGLAWGR